MIDRNSDIPCRLCLQQIQIHARTNQLIKNVLKSWIMLVSIVLLLAGCTDSPTRNIRSVTQTFQDYERTTVGNQVVGMELKHPHESGFTIIRYSRPAFTSRIVLTDLAEKSIDLQYYIWEADVTGWILAERLIRAADRGVRVRILVDDINLSGRDESVASMDAHPNIEIRVFNPFARRKARFLDFLIDMDRVNHRMHNKVMVIDNAVAIVGGRNIGNHYFGVDTQANFRDLDIAAVGPAVREISTMYDTFWNGDWSVPIAELVDRPYTDRDLQEAMETVREMISENDFPYSLERDVSDLKTELMSLFNDLIWAPGRIIWDDPAAIYDENKSGSIDMSFHNKLETLQKELLIESAYFVSREGGVKAVEQLNNRGVRIRVLTNSLVSNDVLAAHAGYAKRRVELVKSGIELYELRPDAGGHKRSGKQSVISVDSKAALHTKAIVFDRESVFVGSFNLDPRSANINTEAGLYVESQELAEQVIAYLDEGVKPLNSYRVSLDEKGDLVWITQNAGKEVRYIKDPNSDLWQRLISGFIKMLPVEGQL